MKKKILAEIAGGIGTLLVLIAYVLLNLGLISVNVLYQTMNLFGAILIIYTCFVKKAKQPLILNIVWAIVAIVGIFQGVFA